MAVASSGSEKKMKSPMKSEKAKRNNSRGVRLVGARIYDSVNGKTCHQCRQKTRDYMAVCKNLKKDKPCTIQFCHKCLSNRYGEKAEEVSLLEDWTCPKCRGICNCSFCMKRRGCQPTGQLVHTAKATGYSSVSDMLKTNGFENVANVKVLKDKSASQKKEESIVPAEKRGKENCIEGVIDSNMQPSHLPKNSGDNQSVGCKRKEVNEKPDGRHSSKNSPLRKEKCKRIKQEGSTEVSGKISSPTKKRSENDEVNDLDLQKDSSFGDSPRGAEKQPKTKFDSKNDAVASVKEALSEKPQDSRENKKRSILEGSVKDNTKSDPIVFMPLPQGTGLTALGGVDLQSEDVGNALQFLEFCGVFGKILDIKKGHPEAVLRDIMQGRSSRRGKCSLTMQFLDNLLSFLKEEEEERFSEVTSAEEKNSWYADLKVCISDSPSVSKTMGLDSLDNGADGFENMDPSKKLKILNFICDEILETVKIRDWIDDQNSKLAEKAKEAKEKLIAAKDEEKCLKQKMQDKIAKALTAKNGAPLSISDHEAIVSQIKSEAAQACADVLEAKGSYSKYTQRCEAIRTAPFFLHTDGHVYWRLKCYSDRSILLCQEIGTGDTAASDEKWSAFDVEQQQIIEKHINSLRVKVVRAQKTPKIPPSQIIEATS